MEPQTCRTMRMLCFVAISCFTVMHWPSLSWSNDLLEQAKKEKEVVLYSTMPVSEFPVFSQAAKEKYPFLTIRHVRISSAGQVSRVMLEHKSGKVQADVIANSLATMLYYREQGVIGKHELREDQQLFIKGTVDHQGYWAGVAMDLLVTASHVKLIARDRAPKHLSDYLDPKFKDLMAIARGHPYPLIGMIELTGQEKGLTYMKRLGQQGLRPVEGYTHMTNLLAAGEFPLAIFAQVSKLEAMKKKGAPIDWQPTTPTFATVSTVGVARGAPHPAAARLLVDFYLSVEGQQALAKTGKIPVRRGIRSSSSELDRVLEDGQIACTERRRRLRAIYEVLQSGSAILVIQKEVICELSMQMDT